MKTMRIISIALLIMTIASFAGISISYGNLNDDNRYRDDSSSVFAPGYLNAAKYQAEAIINQQPQKKSLLQNIIEYVQNKTENKTENKVEQNAPEKPKPVLQQKQSGKSNGARPATTPSKTSDNSIQVDEATKLKIKCDVNGDGKVDDADINEVIKYTGLIKGMPGYDEKYDINNDGRIKINDLDMISNNIGFVITSNTSAISTDIPFNNPYPYQPSVNMNLYGDDNRSWLSDSFMNKNSSRNSNSEDKMSSGLGMAVANKDLTGQTTVDRIALTKLIEESLGRTTLAPSSSIVPGENNVTEKPGRIILGEDQKVLLDSIKTLLANNDKILKGEGKNANPELAKAQNDLLNAVANILLAQGVPDLLKKGDMANIKTIFQELGNSKNKIMLEYARSTRPYYKNVLKDLAKNMAMLQSKNILNPNIAKDELDKLPPSELDKILDKIKKQENKSFEEEYLLQQEAKYRKEYLDPGNKKLESDMKDMMKNFTYKIQDVLKASEKK
jgi:hypothetical protein